MNTRGVHGKRSNQETATTAQIPTPGRKPEGEPGPELKPAQGPGGLGHWSRADDRGAGLLSQDSVRAGARSRRLRARSRQGRSRKAHRPTQAEDRAVGETRLQANDGRHAQGRYSVSGE